MSKILAFPAKGAHLEKPRSTLYLFRLAFAALRRNRQAIDPLEYRLLRRRLRGELFSSWLPALISTFRRGRLQELIDYVIVLSPELYEEKPQS